MAVNTDDMNDRILQGLADTETMRASDHVLQNLGRLAAFLDGYDGHPLDGVFCFYEFSDREKEAIIDAYHSYKNRSCNATHGYDRE